MFLNKKFLLFSVIIGAALFFSSTLMSESTIDRIRNKSKNLQKDIIENNLKKQKEILQKYDKFFKKVRRFAPGLKLKAPVSEKYARDIKRQNHKTRIKRKKVKYAYVREHYRLRSKPEDKNKKYIKKIRRGTKVKIIMSLRVERTNRNYTIDWTLVRVSRRVAGYIPLNLLISNRPKKRKRFTIIDYPDIILNAWGFTLDKILPVGERISVSNFYEAQYNIDSNSYGYNSSKRKTKKIKPIKMKISASPYLNIRSQPVRGAYSVGRAYNNEIVEVKAYSKKKEYIGGRYKPWALISSQGITGWVFSGYLKKIKIKSDDRPADLKAGDTIFVKSDLLRVRDEPGDEGCVITSIPHQKEVKIIDVMDEIVTLGKLKSKWVEIEFEEYTGWVFGGFLSSNKNAFIEGDKIDRQYLWPVEGYRRISSKFGYRWNPTSRKRERRKHKGIDIPGPRGTLIQAAADGIIISRRYSRGYGYVLTIEHPDGNRTVYAHQQRFIAKMGQKVNAGQNIGHMGSTGRSTGSHLHFEVRTGEGLVNPATYVHP